MSDQAPTIGRIVLYRSKVSPYDLPAVVTATRETLWEEGVRVWGETGGRRGVPGLSSSTHVHLHVLTPGAQGAYTEHDVAQATSWPLAHAGAPPEPGSWRWPVIR